MTHPNPLFENLKDLAKHYECTVEELAERLQKETLEIFEFKLTEKEVVIDNTLSKYPLAFPFTLNTFGEGLYFQEQEFYYEEFYEEWE